MKIQKIRWIKPIVWIGEVLLIVSLMGSLVVLFQKRDIVSERTDSLSRVKAEHERLKKELAEAQTQTFVEREAREKLGLIKPGEVVVLVGTTPSGQELVTRTEESSWRAWWKLFF